VAGQQDSWQQQLEPQSSTFTNGPVFEGVLVQRMVGNWEESARAVFGEVLDPMLTAKGSEELE
jgi:hypothetical protein